MLNYYDEIESFKKTLVGYRWVYRSPWGDNDIQSPIFSVEADAGFFGCHVCSTDKRDTDYTEAWVVPCYALTRKTENK
jgi:hypothetical protein